MKFFTCIALLSLFICPIMVHAEEIDLLPYEKRLISQAGEDGVIQKIFRLIGATSHYYVEFGAMDGHYLSNTKYLREKFGWKGLLLDGKYSDKSINLHREFITAENICSLFEKYDVPQEFDLISIDIDRNDFYIWKALGKQYRPRVVVIEFSRYFQPNDDKVIRYSPALQGEGSFFYSGASILSLYNLGRKLGYSLVYQDSTGANLFFIRDDVIATTGIKFKNMNDVQKIYTYIPYKPIRESLIQELFIASSEVLNDI